ncbi:MAG: hypothetical protein NDI94_05245, partial [Candidatus Woesearchaeota archaeon]|nr:hypothetical protein [Candidatus Woesearchaeota archaeon]
SDMAVHRVSHNSHFSSRPLTYEYGTALGIYLIPFNLFSSKKNEFYSALASVNGSHYTTLRSQANYSTLILRPSDESLKYGLRKLVTLANVTRHKYDRYKGMLLADIYRHREEDREQGIKRHALQSIAQRYEEMSEELYPYLKIMSERYLGVLISDLTSTSIFNTYHIDLGEGSPTFGSIFIGSYVPYSSKWSVAVSRCNIKASESDRMLTDFAAVSIRYVMGEPNRFMENFFGKSNVFKISFKEVEKKDEGLIDYLIEYLDILREMQSDIKQKKTGVHYEVLFNMKDRLRLMYERAERNYVESGNLKISIDLIESISKKIGELQDMQMDSSWLVRDLQDLIKHITRSVSDMKAGPYSIRRTFNIWRRGLTKN